MWRLLLYFSILRLVLASCPEGFELARAGACRGLLATAYLSHDEALDEAVAQCNEVQGQPVIIRDDEQQQYWLARALQETQGSLILGLTCNNSSKKWAWTDGSTLDYQPPEGSDQVLNGACSLGCSAYLWTDGAWRVFCDKNSDNVNVFCTTQLPPLPTPSSDGCQSFEDDADDGICYQIDQTAETWDEAQTICRSMGGDIASIHNQRENNFVRRVAVSKGAVNGIFLGAVRPPNSNHFLWVDGSAWDFDNFQEGYPTTGLGDCLSMDTQDSSGSWVNTDCTSKKAFACERNQNYPAPSCSSAKYKEGDIIYSPGFPLDAAIPCDYSLMVAAGKRVQLEIFVLEANTCCDALYLYNDDGKKLASYTGELHDQLSPTSKANLMKVSWKPNGAVNVRGVAFTFRAV